MEWEPIAEDEIWDLINEGEEQMSFPMKRLREVIRIEPVKWNLHPWGDEHGGFWVVAIIGNRVIRYNEFEYGFNTSTYSTYGTINEFFCNQDDLHQTVEFLLTEIKEGRPAGYHMGSPQPGEYSG